MDAHCPPKKKLRWHVSPHPKGFFQDGNKKTVGTLMLISSPSQKANFLSFFSFFQFHIYFYVFYFFKFSRFRFSIFYCFHDQPFHVWTCGILSMFRVHMLPQLRNPFEFSIIIGVIVFIWHLLMLFPVILFPVMSLSVESSQSSRSHIAESVFMMVYFLPIYIFVSIQIFMVIFICLVFVFFVHFCSHE